MSYKLERVFRVILCMYVIDFCVGFRGKFEIFYRIMILSCYFKVEVSGIGFFVYERLVKSLKCFIL